jgi:hypothetical protein
VSPSRSTTPGRTALAGWGSRAYQIERRPIFTGKVECVGTVNHKAAEDPRKVTSTRYAASRADTITSAQPIGPTQRRAGTYRPSLAHMLVLSPMLDGRDDPIAGSQLRRVARPQRRNAAGPQRHRVAAPQARNAARSRRHIIERIPIPERSFAKSALRGHSSPMRSGEEQRQRGAIRLISQ